MSNPIPSLLACLSLTTGLYAAEPAPKPTPPTLKARLAVPFADNGVLQQKIKLPVWGASLPEAKVTVKFADQAKTTIADAAGQWRLHLDPMEAVALKSVNDRPEGQPMTVTCEKDGKQAVTEINNLLVGDVWICAGQSNMAGTMRRPGHSKNFPPNSINDANYPALRHFRPDKKEWAECQPETAVAISRVAFVFAREVQREALVPMGLIVTAVGGSNIESWLNQAPYPTGGNHRKLLEPHVGYGIRGAIWYQGESNSKDGRAYHAKLKSLILGWRAAWNQGDFPVHFVQLPGIGKPALEDPSGGDGRAEIRQAFVETLALENTGMAVTIDIGTPGEHPPNKYDTSIRLARSVLKDVYGIKGVTACPLYTSHKVEGNSIRVSFTDDAEVGLFIGAKATTLPEAFLPPTPTPGAKLDWLAIQDKDGHWHWADGRIEGAELVVSAEGVKEPQAVRYAYTGQPLGHLLYNKDGMPVGPFTTCGYDEMAEGE